MSVIILRGIPGSGKSTLARGLAHDGVVVVSADDYFVGSDGSYKFDPKKLPAAHGDCLRRFVTHLDANHRGVVVDNTNTTAVEVAPYAALALAYGRDLRIITVVCDPVIAAARNIHGVSLDAVKAMHNRLMCAEFPPWWPHEEYRSDDTATGVITDTERAAWRALVEHLRAEVERLTREAP